MNLAPKHLLAAVTLLAASSAFAADRTWNGATNSDWGTGTNWSGVVPAYGSTNTADRLVITNGAGNAAIYDAGDGVTTSFGNGRGLVIGSGSDGSLIINSGTLLIGGTDNPIMANVRNAALTINGGTLDVSGNAQDFRLVLNGAGTAITSTLTLNGGSFVANRVNLFANNNGTLGASTINLNAGIFGTTGITRSSALTAQTSTINFNGGTLQARANSATFLAGGLTSTSTLVQTGGAVIDSNGFDITVGAALANDVALGATRDGGLIKNGAGTLTLSGANTYTGNTVINAGGITLTSQGSLFFKLADGGETNSIQLSGGALTLAGVLNLDLSDITVGAGSWNLITGGAATYDTGFKVSSTTLGDFTNEGGLWTNGIWSFDQTTGALSIAAVPEPSTYGLMGAGALAVAALVRRRRKAARSAKSA